MPRQPKAVSQHELGLGCALAGVLSGVEFKGLQVEVGNKIAFDFERDTIIVPGVPFGTLEDETRDKFRAYLAHEAFGERGNNTWYNDKGLWKDNRWWFVNAANDARVDLLALDAWPGAGMDIRKQVTKDMQEWLQKTEPASKADVAVSLRYIGENLITVDEIIERSPRMEKILSEVRDIIEATDFRGSEKHVTDQAVKVYERLKVESLTQPPPPPPEPVEGDDGDDGAPEDGEGLPDHESEGGGEGAADEEVEVEAKEGEEKQEGSAGSRPAEGTDTTPQDGKGVPEFPEGEYAPMEKRLERELEEELGGVRKGGPPPMFRWDRKSGEHVRKAADTLEETRVSPVAVGVITRLFRALQSAAGRVVMRGQEFGELDEDRIPLAISGRSGSIFYRRRRAVTESLAVYVAADRTGSFQWSWAARTGEMPVFLSSLATALGKLGVPTEIEAVAGGGPASKLAKQTQAYTFLCETLLAFGEKHTKIRSRFVNKYWGGANADIPAMIRGLTRLAQRDEDRKILLFITDGYPCLDYTSDHMQEMYAKGHGPDHCISNTLRTLIAEGARMGITVVPMGIGVGGQRMEQIFGKYWVDLPEPDPDKMSAAFVRQFLKVVQTVEREGGSCAT